MLQSLQVARALAAIGVVAFHLSLMMGEGRYGGRAVFADYTSRGNLGVDFFFVLSGFIIVFAHAADIGQPQRWREYAKRRFVRLYPVYWLYTTVFVVLLAIVGGTVAAAPTHWIDWLGSVSLVRFSAVVPPLPVAWSLFHEIAFYAAFLLLILNKRIGWAVFAVWALACIVNFHPIGEGAATPLNAYTASCNLWFFFGMGAYLLYRRAAAGWLPLLAGVAVLGLAAALAPDHRLWPVVLVTGFALALSGVAKLEERQWFSCPRWLVYAGNASYTIYLTHEQISGTLLKAAMRTGLAARIGGEAVYLLVLVGAVALGCLAYGAIEKPMLRRLSGTRGSRVSRGAKPAY